MSDRKRCRKDNGGSEDKTSILIQTYVFSWRFDNFPDWPECFRVTSNEFQPAKDIVLYATFESYKDKSEDIKTYFKIIAKGKTSFEMEHQLSMTDSAGKVFSSSMPIKSVFDDEKRISRRISVQSKKIIKHSKSTEDQIVIFRCSMEFRGLTTENGNRHLLKSSTDLLPTLAEDFKAMYVDSLYTDFSVLVENSGLRVHKSVLCARSPVFAKMLKSPMDEKGKEAIEISDIDLPTLKAFIEFLYTGNRPPDADFDSSCRLYYAADKYDVSSLRKTCAETLVDKLDAENSCRALSLANRHSDFQLMNVVLDFMQCKFDAVMETEAWFELVVSEPELANRVTRLRVQKSKKRMSN